MTAEWTERILAPAFLRGLDQLVLRQRRSRMAAAGGARAPTVRASGLDWIDHRPYEQGDDLRYLDWRLLSRYGRPWVRRFRAEGSERVDILLDVSGSMTLGDPPKADVGRAVAFCFGYVALAQGERVAATFFSERLLEPVPAGRGPAHRARLLDGLVAVRPRGGTDIGRSLRAVAEGAREIGRAIVISDLLDETYRAGLEALRARGFEVAVVRTRSAEDRRPASDGRLVELVDVETGHRRAVRRSARALAAFGERRLKETAELTNACRGLAIALADLDTSRDLGELVFGELRRAGLFA